MPVYLVTDTICDTKVMVEADKPAGAVRALVEHRFTISQGLDAAAALGLAGDGVRFLPAACDNKAAAPQAELEAVPLIAPAEAVAAAEPEFAEVDEPARPPLGAFEADEVEYPDDAEAVWGELR